MARPRDRNSPKPSPTKIPWRSWEEYDEVREWAERESGGSEVTYIKSQLLRMARAGRASAPAAVHPATEGAQA